MCCLHEFILVDEPPLDSVFSVTFLTVLLIVYAATTCKLQSNLSKLVSMDQEKSLIVKQQLAFLITFALKVGVEVWDTVRILEGHSAREAYVLAATHGVVSIMYKGVPLLYMLVTHVKTFKQS